MTNADLMSSSSLNDREGLTMGAGDKTLELGGAGIDGVLGCGV